MESDLSFSDGKLKVYLRRGDKTLIIDDGSNKTEMKLSSIYGVSVSRRRGSYRYFYYGGILLIISIFLILDAGLGGLFSGVLIIILTVFLFYWGFRLRFYLNILAGPRSVKKKITPSPTLDRFVQEINLMIKNEANSSSQ
ncbi:MAG: hypothetical protein QXV17_05620 [Candidatus Micrarchaeaceae archaeon]